MLLVKTFVAPSLIHGLGLFAGENIPKGTIVWKFHRQTTQVFSKRNFILLCENISLPSMLDFIDYSYIRNGSIYYLNDKTRFINHSSNPNLAFQSDRFEIAIKDIKKGEELTEAYNLSYDKNDFYFLNIPKSKKQENILKYLKKSFFEKNKNNHYFSVRQF